MENIVYCNSRLIASLQVFFFFPCAHPWIQIEKLNLHQDLRLGLSEEESKELEGFMQAVTKTECRAVWIRKNPCKQYHSHSIKEKLENQRRITKTKEHAKVSLIG